MSLSISVLLLVQPVFCFFNVAATTAIYTYRHTLSLLDALPIVHERPGGRFGRTDIRIEVVVGVRRISRAKRCAGADLRQKRFNALAQTGLLFRRHYLSPSARSRSGARSGTLSPGSHQDRKSTRLNSSH